MFRISFLLAVLTHMAALAAVTLAPTERLRLEVGEDVAEASLTNGTWEGAKTSLDYRGSTMQGEVIGEPVELRWSPGRVTGRFAAQPVELTIGQAEAGAYVEGVFAGWPAKLWVSPSAIAGELTGCTYSLVSAGDRYSGWRTCAVGALPEAVEVQLPRTLARREDAGQAALVTTLLARRELAF